ncbi:hypothetical protein D1007_18363 [Hordeum vulgare]|nr:hypothetical protein D1007_18363 [Hordeum vulgare]
MADARRAVAGDVLEEKRRAAAGDVLEEKPRAATAAEAVQDLGGTVVDLEKKVPESKVAASSGIAQAGDEEYHSNDDVDKGNIKAKEVKKIKAKGSSMYKKGKNYVCPYCTTKRKLKDGIYEHLLSHGRDASIHSDDYKDASLPPYEEFINGLNTQQRMYIQLIGLGGLLKTPSIKIRCVLCLAIANSYDAEQDAFIINGRPRRITLEDVAHITGMPCDGKKHIPSNLDNNMELWKKLKDRNDTKITFKGLLAKMKGDSTPNFVRPFVLYTIGKYVSRTKEEYAHNKYIGIVRNLEMIKGTNLGQLTLDYLVDSVKNYVNVEAILEGNLPLPQAQIKVLVRRVLTDLQEVASLVWEAGAEQVDRMYTLEKKMDECLRHICTNGKLMEDLIKELNAYIDKFRRELPVVLVDSAYNKMKYMKRFKQYHARLLDAAAVEDGEDARTQSSDVVHSYMWSVHLAIKR